MSAQTVGEPQPLQPALPDLHRQIDELPGVANRTPIATAGSAFAPEPELIGQAAADLPQSPGQGRRQHPGLAGPALRMRLADLGCRYPRVANQRSEEGRI